jgi:hypothetical protein
LGQHVYLRFPTHDSRRRLVEGKYVENDATIHLYTTQGNAIHRINYMDAVRIEQHYPELLAGGMNMDSFSDEIIIN